MKMILSNAKRTIQYSLTIMATAVALGLIFLLAFGFNTSAEYGNMYQITIFSFDNQKIESYIETTEDVLDNYGYSAKEIIIEEHNESDAVVVKYASKSENNAIKIGADIVKALEINENLVKVESLGVSSAKADSIELLIAFGVIAVALFVYMWLRYTYKEGVVLASSIVLTGILSLALMLITRMELSLVSLGVVVMMSVLSGVLVMTTISKIKSIEKQQDKPKTFKENYLNYIDSVKFRAIVPAALGLLVFICFLMTFIRSLVHVGLVGIVSIVVMAVIVIGFAPCLQILLNKEEKDKTNEL